MESQKGVWDPSGLHNEPVTYNGDIVWLLVQHVFWKFPIYTIWVKID